MISPELARLVDVHVLDDVSTAPFHTAPACVHVWRSWRERSRLWAMGSPTTGAERVFIHRKPPF